MSLSIKNAEAERLARELASETGESVTGAVGIALRERLTRIREGDGVEVARRVTRLREIAKDAGTRWIEPYRTADHGDLLYDDRGLPR